MASRVIALEWDDEELRCVVATKRRNQMCVEHAFSAPLAGRVVLPDESNDDGTVPEDPEESGEVAALQVLSPAEVGEKIAAAMAAHRVGKGEVVVSISRSLIELRQMSFPPAADTDLPEMVRFQVEREFPHVDADWLVDYLPLDDDPSQPRRLLVAAMPPAIRRQIEETADAAELKIARMMLRPTGAAVLVNRRLSRTADEVTLLVDLLAEEIDLTVLEGNRVVLMRTARLTGDPLAPNASILSLQGEIRRTMAAAQNQLGGRPIERIVLFGATSAHEQLASRLGEKLRIRVECCDPFAPFAVSDRLASQIPDHPGRFAPLLGMAADELEGVDPPLDFLHPHKPPEPPSARNRAALAILTGLLLIVAMVVASWSLRAAQLDRARNLSAGIKKLDKELQDADELRKLATAVDRWQDRDICWLEEIRRLCDKGPSAEEVMLTKISAGAGGSGGELVLDGLARDVEAVEKLEDSLHDATHHVVSKDKSSDESQRPYTLRFTTMVLIEPADPQTPAAKEAE